MVATTQTLTYKDLAMTPEGDGKRYELIGGEIVVAASPAIKHVRLTFRLARIISDHVESGKLGEVFPAPADVRLTPYDVVVPDILFLSIERANLAGAQQVEGAPDLIVEVLSPATRQIDLTRKKDLYARTGVAEYWIVDIEQATIAVNILNAKGAYQVTIQREKLAASRVLPNLRLDLLELFRDLV